MRSFKPKFLHKQNNNQLLKLIPLGGMGDVTKNMYVYEYGNDIIVVDCGIGFPDESMPGVDFVIPDTSYLNDKKDRIRGFIITHGHEDHLGGLPYIWPKFQAPIYTQRLTAGFIRNKFAEFDLPKNAVHELKIHDKLNLGAFQISFYQVSHSVPDSTGIVIKTPVGTIVHQADFKIDWTPPSKQVTDVETAAQVGAAGVKLLLIDCLRIEKSGFNKSESLVEESFERVALEAKGKILITMTSSNVSRMQQAVNVASKLGKKLAVVGRSFESNFQIARDLGYLTVPPNLVITSDAISSFGANKVMILIAGAFGQIGSSLSRAANGEHKQVKLLAGDSVVFSADPIPSTEMAYNALIDNLINIGVNVYYSAISPNLHISGHAAADELKLMVNLIKPEFMIPIGGEFRQMKHFSNTFQKMGYKPDQILELKNGQIAQVSDNVKVSGAIEIQNIFVDGLGVGDVGHVVLRDRQVMSEEGIVIVVIPFDRREGKLAGDPDIISRGFVFEDIAQDLLDDAKKIVKASLDKHDKRVSDWRFIRHSIEEELEKYLYHITERRPLILPLIVEV